MALQILRVIVASVLWSLGTWPLFGRSDQLEALVLPLWFLAAFGLGFMYHRWWALLLAPTPSLGLIYEVWIGRAHFEGGPFLGVSVFLTVVGLAGLSAGWFVWRGVDRALLRQEQPGPAPVPDEVKPGLSRMIDEGADERDHWQDKQS